MAGLEAMITAMEALIGTGESPSGSNQNKVTAWYGLVGPWCDMAISYAAYHSGNQDAVCFGEKQDYTVAHAQAFKDHGQWHTDVAGISRGSIVFFDWDGSNNIEAIDHVGIVTAVQGANVLTIEGNIDNVCARKVRTADVIVGYGRPAYAAAPVPPPTPKPVPTPKPSPAPAYEPFPGVGFFTPGRTSPIVAATHARLIAVGCNRYQSATGKNVWGSGDTASYRAWQQHLGYTGADADGTPGKASWDALKVPKQ